MKLLAVGTEQAECRLSSLSRLVPIIWASLPPAASKTSTFCSCPPIDLTRRNCSSSGSSAGFRPNRSSVSERKWTTSPGRYIGRSVVKWVT